MNKKKGFLIAIPLLVVTLSVGIVVFEKSKPVEVVEMNGSVVAEYKTVEQLKNDAPIIAEVKALDVKYTEYSNVPFTLTDVKVERVFKGTVGDQKQITILETGGIKDNKNFAFEGNEVFKKNEKAIVFLEKYEGPVAGNAYVIKGVYQGKFKINDSGQLEAPKHAMGELANVKERKDLKLE